MDKRKIAITIIAFIIIEGISFLMIENSHKQEINEYLKKNTLELKVKYKAVQNTYTLMTETILTQVINKPKILKLYSNAYQANSEQKQRIRDSLYNMLLPVYNYLKLNNIKQLHFHLPDNHSFLRFHRPNKHGDDLTNFRYSVKMTNATKQKYKGFEEGKIYNGFRYVFPLFCENKHIGSVETSFSFNAIEEQLKQHEDNIYGFMLNKSLVKGKVFDTEKSNYILSLLSEDYMCEKGYLHYTNDTLNILKQIDIKLKPLIADELAENKSFTVYQQINNNYYLISFVSINNVEGKPAAYIFSYKKDTILSKYKQQYYLSHILSIIILAIVALAVILIQFKNSKIKDSEEHYRALIENSNDIISVIDSRINSIYRSPSYEKVLGYKLGENVNNLFEFVHTDDKKRMLNDFKGFVAKPGKTAHMNYRYLHKDGTWRHLEGTGKNMLDSPVIKGIVLNIRDVTKRKNAELALRENEKKLRDLNATKDKFFSIIAHDLKSPFSAMLGFSQLLINKFEKYDVQKQKRFLGIINSDLKNTYKLLDNLLLWSQSQKGIIDFKPEKENFYLVAVETLGFLYQTAKNKTITLINQVPEVCSVYADKDMLETILRNLISNAIKFTLRKGEIILSSRIITDENEQKFVEISVKDNGVGIPREMQGSLFNVSENNSTKGTENETGTGLGLTLCKEFVEQHGGKIWVESELDKGSTFIFLLPEES
ncbi:MAG: hypothetical protein DRJ07_03020 [Bacteroidetes bacterium]|nr:MAG: hypothetical protein DRJ07_03020 [Bacteroidota bacterium]